MRFLVRVSLGVVLVIAGIAIHWGSHPATAAYDPFDTAGSYAKVPAQPASFSLSTYQVLQLSSWVLLIVGGLIIVIGLIAYWRSSSQPDVSF